jgi:hypothetical protein
MDQVLDGEAHALILLHERAGVSQVEHADLAGARAERKREPVLAVVQRRDFAIVASENSHPPVAPRVVEFDSADRCTESAESVCLFCHRRHVDRSNIDATLQAPPAALAYIDLPRAEELPSLQIKPKDLAKPRAIRAQPDGRNKHFGTLAQIC